ncbi:MAG TPA: guanylate kinase [Bacteroidales bacterium]|nr:guanylate kinase [Bacteroidales bacterium]HPS51492.1 guanylate kinase [Bacteroidales bacterium]
MDPINRKAIIVSAPSGAGKTTIVQRLLHALPYLDFSISACSRPKRDTELHGKDYYFLDIEDFRQRIARDEFVEWQEVYPGNFYGTLKSELDRIWSCGKIPVFDVDVQGGLNLKKYFGDRALSIFIQPPSLEAMFKRLQNRGTETEESLKKRTGKAAFEMTFRDKFDRIIVNDDLEPAFDQTLEAVTGFLAGCPAGT